MKRRDLFKALAALPFVALGVKATVNTTADDISVMRQTAITDPTVTMVSDGVYHVRMEFIESRGGYTSHA